MKSRNIKTRLAAFGLALLMGLSPLGNLADVHAAETKNPSEPVTESAEISETEQTEEVSEAAKHLVTAEDITKDISDKDFMAETCMEGIHYNSEQEDVTLERIEAEDGGSYHPDQAGTYIATYWVVPKDARDSYSVSRKIILTDTEGQAHTEENGGQKQKEDTNSEEDSETPVQEIPDVEVTVSGEDADAQAARELEEKIEDGEVMMLSGAENTFRAKETVHLEKGETIYYPSYIGNYLTCWFTVNGKIAYCLESHRSSPPSGDYVAQVLDSNKNLQKVLYYGYGGAGDITGSYLSGKSAEEKYVYTHIAASYAYAGEAGFTGCKYEDLVNAGVIAYIDHLFAMEEPPKGEISLSKTSVKAVRNGNVQKTPDITLSGDHRNYISVNVPKDITIYNKTKGTSAENGALKIYGGDTFYLTAPMLHTGNYSSGELHGSVGETWRTLVLSTGNSNQDIGVFESEKANPVSFTVDWLEMTRIELFKQDADTKNPLDGAVYGIYTDSKCEHLLMEMPVTGEEGKAVSDYFEAAIKTVYVKEIKAPDKYAQSDVIHKVDVEAGKTVTISATDERVKGAVHIQKIDKETQAFLPQGDSSLAGAVYGLYAREDIVHPDGKTGVLFKKDSLIAQGVIKEDGTLDFPKLYLGKMYVKEITPPEGYTVDPTEYEVDLAYEGQEVAEVTRDLTVQETKEMLDDLTTRDQRMMFGILTMVHMADSKKQLDSDTESILSVARKHLCQMATLKWQQVDGLNTVLPYGIRKINALRTLTTESTAVLIPFHTQEIMQPGGIYYGQNAVSKNMLVADRRKLLNGNSFRLGVSGSGKSFSAKEEIVDLALSTEDDILILDPESEFGSLVEALNGEVISISAMSHTHLNALDMDSAYGNDKNPLIEKSEFILSLFEQLVGAGNLSAKEKSILDRCTADVYREYIRSGYQSEVPTLKDLYRQLMLQPEEEARGLALSSELFINGSLNTFAQKTNVDTKNRIIAYDIRELGEQLMPLGMLVTLDSIFNRVIQNWKKGKTTWIFADEFYLLFRYQYSADFFYRLYKRIRKYQGFVTGLTQNVEELLKSDTARLMLANSEFLILLNQATTDRDELASLLNISENQLSYITNVGAGKGLIRCSGNLVPFENSFPKNTKLYRLMTTKPGEC